MIIEKNTDLLIESTDPFYNDKLFRKNPIINLTNIIRGIQLPFVFSIEGPWGTGKTSFIKMWKQYLENNNFIAIYFNAWENDFNDDPINIFIKEIMDQLDSKKVGKTQAFDSTKQGKLVITIN